jgi:mono/diheme cytochrome c family protein
MSLVRISKPAVATVLALAALSARADQKAASNTGQSVYERECATCHGPLGKGDGETAAYLTPQPQDFTTGTIQKRSDEFLAIVIAKGGAAKGLSESMPGFPKLSKAEVQSVVAYVRQLSKGSTKQR